MYKLLGASDGFINNPTKKIILSTNLPSITEIDEALLRKGRCYDVLKMKRLTPDQAVVLLAKIKPDYAKPLDKKEYTLAELYAL
jgi:ATP-dependent 26S proteasome regulatory subunit